MSPKLPYATSAAFRRAMNDAARAVTRSSGQPTDAVVEGFMLQRLCERLVTNDNYVLKGGNALFARIGPSRRTSDVDLGTTEDDINVVISELRALAAQDLGDYLRFEVQKTKSWNGTVLTLPVNMFCGDHQFNRIKVDVHVGATTSREPDLITPPPHLFSGLALRPWRLYPLVDHIADKYCAIIETHRLTNAPSTRVHDLVDIVLIATRCQPDGEQLHLALHTERLRRTLPDRDTFTVPTGDAWRRPYEALAAKTPAVAAYRELDNAITLARTFIDPALTGAAGGLWDPRSLAWPSPATP